MFCYSAHIPCHQEEEITVATCQMGSNPMDATPTNLHPSSMGWTATTIPNAFLRQQGVDVKAK